MDVRAASAAEQQRVDQALRLIAPVLPGAAVVAAPGPTCPPMEPAASADLFVTAQRVAGLLGLEPLRGVAVGGGSDGNRTAGVGTPTLDGLGAVGGGPTPTTSTSEPRSSPQRAALLAALLPNCSHDRADGRRRHTAAGPGAPGGGIEWRALRVAQAAARASGVHIRELAEVDDVQQLCELVDEIWHPNPANAAGDRRVAACARDRGQLRDRRVRRGQLAGRLHGVLRSTGRAHAAFAHRVRVPAAARQARGLRAQAASARVGAVPRHLHDRLDVRPAGVPQRVFQRREARGLSGRLPARLLRPDA